MANRCPQLVNNIELRLFDNRIRRVKVVAFVVLILIWGQFVNSASEQLTGDGTTLTELMGYMTKFGYLPPVTSAVSQLMSADQIKDAIKLVQKVAKLTETGLLDDATSAFIKKRRCGVSDVNLVETLQKTSSFSRRRQKRYEIYRQRYKWNHNLVTWTLDRDSRKVYRPYVLQEFRKAFKLWSDASPLRFQELAPGSGSKADIVVRFEARDHGDRYQFDGPGLTLAHAFPPSGASSLSGDLHMDDDEDWAVNSEALKDTYTKTSIFVVAAHELGHSLGLDHSSDDQAIMYAAYMGAKDYLTLPPDDKLGIKALYDWNPPPPPPPPAPRPPPPPRPPSPTSRQPSPPTPRPSQPSRTTTTSTTTSDMPDICKSSFDAIAAIRGELHFFKDQYMWRLTTTNDLYGPILISSFWRGLPPDVKKIDAAYEKPRSPYDIYLFSGNRYWTFQDTRMIHGPHTLTSLGLPRNIVKLDAILVWGHTGTTYLFSGYQYWKMEQDHLTIRSDYPKEINAWNGVTYPVTSAVRWTDGKTYFFKDNLFWEFDDKTMKTTNEPGKPIHSHWFNCPSPNGNLRPLPAVAFGLLLVISTLAWSFYHS